MGDAISCPACGEAVPGDVATCPRDGTSLGEVTSPSGRRDPLIGTMIGDYRVESFLGAGGMGVVYRALEPRIAKSVAIKVLRTEYARDPEQVKRLVAEAKAVNAIRHRGIVDIFAIGDLPDGRPYLVMELLEGESLDAVIARRGPLPASEVLSLFKDCLEALAAAHGAGIVHRDLKPSNLFLVQPRYGAPYLKLLDFGLAKSGPALGGLGPQTHASTLLGTPLYMAPEQIRGEPVTPRTDLYAMGVVLYEALTGRRPFEAPTVVEILHQHLNSWAKRPGQVMRGIPAALDALVMQLLAKNPAARPESAEAVLGALASVRADLDSVSGPRPVLKEGEEDTLRSSPRDRSAVMRAFRSRGPALGVAAAAAVLVAGIVALVIDEWDARTSTPTVEASPAIPVMPEPAPPPPPASPAPGSLGAAPADEPGEPAAPAPPPVVDAPRAQDKARPVKPRPAAATASPDAVHAKATEPPGGEARHADGLLQLHVFPWADIYVDGTLRQRGAMDFEVTLPAGEHLLRLVNPRLSEHEERVTVIGGGRLEKRIRLRRADGQ